MPPRSAGRARSGSANPAKAAPTHPGTPIAELSQNRQRKRAKIRLLFLPCRRATFLSCTYAGNVCSTWRELDLGQWKQSVLKDFLYRHSAPQGPGLPGTARVTPEFRSSWAHEGPVLGVRPGQGVKKGCQPPHCVGT